MGLSLSDIPAFLFGRKVSMNAWPVAVIGVDSNGKPAAFGVTAGATATGTLTFVANPADGDTVTVGGKTYTFQTTLTNVANNVFIGAAATNSLDNLIAAINRSSGAGTLYAAATEQNTKVNATAGAGDTMTVTALTTGVYGNSIATTETFTNAGNVFGAATLTGGTNAVLNVSTTLPASSAVIGKVGIDQTTPGTTNAVVLTALAADNDASSGNPTYVGGVAVVGSTYNPAYTAGDRAVFAFDTVSGGLLVHNRIFTRAIDSISADPKQLTTVSTATPATTDATVFTLAAGEKGVIQNLSADAPLAYKLGASASTSSFNGILQTATTQDDGRGGLVVIDDFIGAVSVAKITGTARYIAYKLS